MNRDNVNDEVQCKNSNIKTIIRKEKVLNKETKADKNTVIYPNISNKKDFKIFEIIITVLSVLLTAAACVLFIRLDTRWYESLIKPELLPEPLIFECISAAVYILDIASLVILNIYKYKNNRTYIYLIAAAVLNVLWSFSFFTLKLPIIAVIILILHIVMLYLSIIDIIKKIKLAGILLLPNLIWILFISVINYLIAFLN